MYKETKIDILNEQLEILDRIYVVGDAAKTYKKINRLVLFCNQYEDKAVYAHIDMLKGLIVDEDEFTTYANIRKKIRELFISIDMNVTN